MRLQRFAVVLFLGVLAACNSLFTVPLRKVKAAGSPVLRRYSVNISELGDVRFRAAAMLL